MADRHYPIYDTALFSTALATHVLFSESEGSSSTKQSEDTNMLMGGHFATSETFKIERICTFVDDNLAQADLALVWEQSFMRLMVEQETMIQIPLRMTAYREAWSGVLAQTTGADRFLVGLKGDGLTLKVPIVIKGGRQFKVEVVQGTVLNGTDQRVKVILDGILSRQG
jgi:hypothetical protein